MLIAEVTQNSAQLKWYGINEHVYSHKGRHKVKTTNIQIKL